jgi:hypothetical protein
MMNEQGSQEVSKPGRTPLSAAPVQARLKLAGCRTFPFSEGCGFRLNTYKLPPLVRKLLISWSVNFPNLTAAKNYFGASYPSDVNIHFAYDHKEIPEKRDSQTSNIHARYLVPGQHCN